jgi:hypothetical protein
VDYSKYLTIHFYKNLEGYKIMYLLINIITILVYARSTWIRRQIIDNIMINYFLKKKNIYKNQNVYKIFSNILQPIEYYLTPKICFFMQNTFFSVNSVFHES